MERINLLCESENCGKDAIAFGLKGSLKTRSCEVHLASLLAKKMQTFDIEGYSFVSSLHDVAVFEERKTLAERGQANLTVLEQCCESELTAALAAIELAKAQVLKSAERRFEEMREVVTATCNEARRQLALLEVDFQQFLVSKENHLSPTALLACSTMSFAPQFIRFGIADVSDCVSSVLSDSWAIASVDVHSTMRWLDASWRDEAIENALAEASERAQKGIPDALRYADLLIGDEASYDDGKHKVLMELLKNEKSRIERNLKWLHRSWDLGQRFKLPDEAVIEVGRQLARLLCLQLGKSAKAEEALKHCYGLVEQRSPGSKELMSLSLELCGVYYASGQDESASQLAAWVHENSTPGSVPAELYWTAALYRIHSMWLRPKDRQACTFLEDWGKLEQLRDDSLAAMMQLLAHGLRAYCGGDEREAEKCLLRARRIGTSRFATSPFTTFAVARLALVSEEKAREEKFLREAQSMYEVVAPMSTQAAKNTYNLGLLLTEAEIWGEAEQCFRQAHSINQSAPMSIHVADNLRHLGLLLKRTQHFTEAEKCHRQAKVIYESVAPKSVEAANNLDDLGALMDCLKRLREAEDCYREAQLLYQAVAPKSLQAAHNCRSLGTVCEAMEQRERAIDSFVKAASIYAENDDATSRSEVEEKAANLRKSDCVIS